MTRHLTPGQHALLEQSLQLRLHQLDQRLARHRQTRAEQAHELLAQDADDAPQRDADREVALALSDREMQDLGEVSSALARIRSDTFGRCADCGAEIPFDRLKVEPWAARCVGCEARHEPALRRPRGASL